MLWDKLVWVRRRPEPVWAKSRKAELTWERWDRCTYDQAFPGEGQGMTEGPGREAIAGLGYGRGGADDAARLTAYLSSRGGQNAAERLAGGL